MMKSIKHLLFIAFCFIPLWSLANIKDIGIPNIINHSKASYRASTQNWSVTQSDKGFIYFGNNDGVLEYDGTNWRLFPVSNASVVRSVLAVGDTIYTGAFEELGYLAPDTTGMLAYHSLKALVPPDFADFDEIWNIYAHQGSIYFQSFNYIFILSDGKLRALSPITQFGLLHVAGENFYIVDNETGFMQLRHDSLVLLSDHPVFFRNEIRCVLPLENDNLLIGTSNEGLFVLSQKGLAPWNTGVNSYLKEHNLFSAIRLSDGNLAFGSISNGVYISNPQGQVLQHLNRYKGLQNNTILSLYEDQRRNLWLGLDNGIDFVETSSPLTSLNYNYNIESAYASIIHQGIIYVGTNQGLYAAPFAAFEASGSFDDKFTLIRGTEGQVWTLQVIDNTLFCGHNFGSFQIEGYAARQISDIRGFWSFASVPHLEDIILAGTYTGLVRLTKDNGRWVFLDEVAGFRESSRSMFVDHNHDIWISHGYKGLFQLKLDEDFSQVTHAGLFRARAGLPPSLPYNIQQIDDQMIITTPAGIFGVDHPTATFTPHQELNELFHDKGFIDKIQQDQFGNIWYFTNQNMGFQRLLEDGTFRDITTPFSNINQNLLPSFENIFIHDNRNIFIGSQNGLIHYNPLKIKDYNQPEEVFIKEAGFYGKEQSMLTHYPAQAPATSSSEWELPFSLNSVTFRFTVPSFENPAANRFSYRLKGFEDQWSAWDDINFKEYTNLKEGHYVFEIKAMNSFQTESPVSTFAFQISPPALRSPLAYAIYILILALIIAANIIFMRRRILKIRKREKIRHEKRLAQREQVFKEKTDISEKEIIQLRHQSLMNEMNHKNKELANTTLHIIHKNRTLTSLRNELAKLQKSTPADRPEKQIVNNLIKKINKDLRNEKNWDLFNDYFDEVHQDFIQRIKEKHQDLSPKELRLCAYLRMNISTKEIAPLMNISVRGVEISRYRLRKKMDLHRDANLTEYIMTF